MLMTHLTLLALHLQVQVLTLLTLVTQLTLPTLTILLTAPEQQATQQGVKELKVKRASEQQSRMMLHHII